MSSPTFSLTAGERQRIEDIDHLVALGAGGVTPLLAAMSDPSWTVRRAAVAALASLGDDASAALCAWLRDQRTSEHAIAAAVDALAGSIGGSVTHDVMAMLDHANPAVAADAAHILGRRRASEAAVSLGRMLGRADDNVAVASIEALGTIGGSAAVEPLIALLAQKSFFRTFPALQVLPATGDPRVIAPIAALLGDAIYQVEAVRALGRTGAALAVAPLAALLPTADDELVRVIARALADLIARAEWSGAGERVVAALEQGIAPSLSRFLAALVPAAGSSRDDRTAIIAVLGRIGGGPALPVLAVLLEDTALAEAATDAIQRICRAHEAALLEVLRHGEPATRVAVLPVVGARGAAADVRALLDDEEPEVRARACEALARISDPASVPQLFARLGDPSPRVTHSAAAAIQSLGTADTGRLAIAAVETGAPAVRRQALRIIGTLGCDGAFDAVHAAVADPDRRIAELAVAAFGALDDARVEPTLRALASDPVEAIRAAAMRAIAHRAGPEAAELLERGLRDDAAWVRYYACQGLGRLGIAAATSPLIARLADATPHVRLAAIEALALVETDAAWQALSAMVRSPDADQQRAALIGIGIGMGGRAAALPFLLDATTAPDAATRLIAISGLAPRREPEALAGLGTAARDEAPEVREAALSLLAERTDRPAADLLVAVALANPPAHPAHPALSRPGAARIASIQARLVDADARDAAVLVAALARMHDPAAIAALVASLELENPEARRAAAAAVIALDVADARGRIAQLALHDPDPEVRRVCAVAAPGA